MLCIRSKSCKYFLQPILGETAKNSWDISDGMLGWSTYKCFFPSGLVVQPSPQKNHEKPTEVRAQDHISMNGVQLQGNRFPWAITRLTGVEHVQGISTWNQLKLKHAEALNTSQHSREAWSPPINGPTHQKKTSTLGTSPIWLLQQFPGPPIRVHWTNSPWGAAVNQDVIKAVQNALEQSWRI